MLQNNVLFLQNCWRAGFPNLHVWATPVQLQDSSMFLSKSNRHLKYNCKNFSLSQTQMDFQVIRTRYSRVILMTKFNSFLQSLEVLKLKENIWILKDIYIFILTCSLWKLNCCCCWNLEQWIIAWGQTLRYFC